MSIIAGPGLKPIALTQNLELMAFVEAVPSLAEKLEAEGSYQNGNWRIIRRSVVTYQGGRTVYDCLALSAAKGGLSAAGRPAGAVGAIAAPPAGGTPSSTQVGTPGTLPSLLSGLPPSGQSNGL